MAEKTFVPLYKKIYEDMKRKIEQGHWKPGEKLPCERELYDFYGVKRVTIRKSLEMLAQDGLIHKHMGLGSFVTSKEKSPSQASSAESAATILFAMRRNDNDIYHNTSTCNTRIFFEMEQICRSNGYLLSYVGLDEDTSLSEIVHDHPIAGVFLASSYLEKTIEELRRLDIPALMLNQYAPDMLCVMPDNLGMLLLVIKHLTQVKHTRIAYIDGMPDSHNAIERWNAFRFAMHVHDLAVDPLLYVVGNWTYEGGRMAARKLLELDELPTAIFAASDMMAAGAMEELRLCGLNIPQDISVIGYDNLDLDVMLTPPLSSATIDFKAMCAVAFEQMKMIMEKGNREMDHYVIRMPASLIRRESVCPPKAKH